MSAIVRSAVLGAAAVLGVGLLASPAFASPSHQGGHSGNWRAPWLIDTNIVVGFPQHQGVTGGVDAQGFGGLGPTVTTQPKSESVTAGSTASFSAAASGFFTPTVQWYDSTNSGSSFSAISGATSDTYSFTAQSSQNGYEYEAIFTNGVGTPATTNAATLTVTAAPATLVQSSNWSGYADTGGPYNRVSATWNVPTVTCSGRSNGNSAEWVGIDGYSSSTVEQDGSEAYCSGGSPFYYAWYELYGDNSVNSGDEVELSPSTYPVSPGDTISASVSVSGTTWTLVVSDSQQGWSYSTNIVFSGAAQSSAEWVVERPEECSFFSCSLTSLADFGSVQFLSASASTNSSSGTISANSYSAIEMVNGSTVLALPGALDAAGDSFTDTWKAAG